jgi:hypothetical protein
MQSNYELEKYKDFRSSRHTCPACGKTREFVRYIDRATGEYLNESVGRCNRESKCGYHLKPKQFFADNPNARTDFVKTNQARRKPRTGKLQNISRSIPAAKKSFDCIPAEIFLKSIERYHENAFVQFLHSQFEKPDVRAALIRYFVGTSRNGRTVFWQIDDAQRVRTGKLIAYDAATGKRCKAVRPSWVHAELKQAGKLSPDFALSQCLFGEHLLSHKPDKPAAIVEAEKTAIIASIMLPSFIWLATGSKQNLSPHLFAVLRNRNIALFPDADAFEQWSEKADELRRAGFRVSVSDLIERRASDEEKENGFDLADYLIPAGWRDVEETNAAIDRVKREPHLWREFKARIKERLAIIEFDGNLSRREAFAVVTESDALRTLALEIKPIIYEYSGRILSVKQGEEPPR